MSSLPRLRGVISLSLALLCMAAVGTAGAGDDDPLGIGSGGVLKATAALAPRASAPTSGSVITVNVTLSLKAGWHIYANPAADESVRPTVVGPHPDAPAKLIATEYPPGLPSPQPGSDTPVLIYEPRVTIPVTLQLADNLPAGPFELPILIQYQPCNDRACLAPAKLTIPVRFNLR